MILDFIIIIFISVHFNEYYNQRNIMKITGYESVESIRRELGRRIQQARIADNMTQKECASRSGVSAHTISNLENGNDVSLTSFCLVLRELGFLSGIDLLIPDESSQPTALLKEPRVRYRAGSRKTDTAHRSENRNRGWVWGDEK